MALASDARGSEMPLRGAKASEMEVDERESGRSSSMLSVTADGGVQTSYNTTVQP